MRHFADATQRVSVPVAVGGVEVLRILVPGTAADHPAGYVPAKPSPRRGSNQPPRKIVFITGGVGEICMGNLGIDAGGHLGLGHRAGAPAIAQAAAGSKPRDVLRRQATAAPVQHVAEELGAADEEACPEQPEALVPACLAERLAERLALQLILPSAARPNAEREAADESRRSSSRPSCSRLIKPVGSA